jgi:hypothetical protein
LVDEVEEVIQGARLALDDPHVSRHLSRSPSDAADRDEKDGHDERGRAFSSY